MGEEDFHKTYPFRTVCEVTREIYRLITAAKDEGALDNDLYNAINIKLHEQMRMQKKMDAKLRLYKPGYEAEMYKKTEGAPK